MGNIEFSLDIKEICKAENIFSQNNIRKFRKGFCNFNIKEIEEINNKFLSIPMVGAAIEVMSCLFKHLNNQKIKHSLIQRLIYNYPYESYKDHKLLAPYKIIQEANFFKYVLNNEYVEWIPDKIVNRKPEMLITKIQVMSFAFQCSILNRSDEKVTKEIFKYIITAINLYFKSPTEKFEHYIECAKYILPVIKLIEPKSQLLIIQELVPCIKFSLDLSDQFADLLMENKNFEAAKTLLEASIFSLDTNTEDQTLARWYYRVGRVYKETGDYNISTKCYKYAFTLLPNHELIAFGLWSNYRIQGKFNKAQNLVAQIQTSEVKSILEMLTNPYEISYKSEKFASIKRDTLSSFYATLYDGCEYMAFYNKIPDKQALTKKQELKLAKKLEDILDSSDNALLVFSLAICTKQYKISSDLLNSISQNTISLYDNAILKFRSYIDPNYVLPKNNNLNPAEEVEVLNTVNTTLIADTKELTSEKAEKIFQNIENALQNDSHNENTLEIGVAAALLNTNKEKLQKYASKLSQEKQEEIITSYASDNKQIVNLEQLIYQCDAKKIHQYYQLKKKYELHLIVQKITNFNKNSWNIPIEGKIEIDNEVEESKAILLGKYRGLDCYGTISKKIYTTFKNEMIPFISALKKGIIHHKYGVNGIKIIRKNAFEAKWNCEKRLFTNKLYFNEQGLLINFDEYGNHEEVKKFISGHQLEFYNIE